MISYQKIVGAATIADVLKNDKSYLAHTPDETLHQHMLLVAHYFLKLIEVHGLETIIDNKLLDWAKNDEELATAAKRMFWEAIFYHDFGKVNENFQNKLQNPLFTRAVNNGIESQHSILSAFIFLNHKISEVFDTSLKAYSSQINPLIVALGYNIVRHHSPALSDLSDNKTYRLLTKEKCEKLKKYLDYYKVNYSPKILIIIPELSNKFFDKQEGSTLFLLVRLNFSLLTAADYYATSHYKNGWRTHYSSFGILSGDEKKNLYSSLKTLQAHNKSLYENLSQFQELDETKLKAKQPANLNLLRTKMAADVVKNIRANVNENLFYIEAPTGGGKSNLSFIALCELLQTNTTLCKAFYVFPFTTLITQTKKAAQETLNITDDQFIELHGKAGFKELEKREMDEDGLYNDERLDNIHNQFANYPFIFLSHIRFFNILTANQKDSIYLLHRLANSVVIIDEIQAYNPLLWDKVAYLLETYAKFYNIKIIVMSATLPKIGKLTATDFHYLLPDSITRFFNNPNFSERVNFDNGLIIDKASNVDRETLLNLLTGAVFEKAEAYREKHKRVRVIIEFIFKKSATEFAQKAAEVFAGYELFVLSGTILEPRRKQIINYLKNPLSLHKNILLISTQVVEAGVDIDMDIGFKNRSIVDSEEQLAGRVNRNAKKNGCTVYLFDLDDASVIYGKDLRYKMTGQHFKDDYLTLLNEKKFELIYDKVNQLLIESNDTEYTGGNLTSYKRATGQLNFPKVEQDFQLIKEETVGVFVPLDLPIEISSADGNLEFVLNNRQIEFLNEAGIKTTETIAGKDVFDLYINLIRNRSNDFDLKKQNHKILQSIMSQFTFSLFAQSKLIDELKGGGDQIVYGYLLLNNHSLVYDYELGLVDSKFKELIFL